MRTVDNTHQKKNVTYGLMRTDHTPKQNVTHSRLSLTARAGVVAADEFTTAFPIVLR